MKEQEIPYGYCQCGCGQKTKIAKQTKTERGHVVGQPIGFVNGHNRRLPVTDRFWQHTDKKSEEECWPWNGCISSAGYGQIRLDATTEGKGKLVLASRLSWEIHNGPIPINRYVLHKCDNPCCVNPHHLWIGTLSDNTKDMYSKGRGRKKKT